MRRIGIAVALLCVQPIILIIANHQLLVAGILYQRYHGAATHVCPASHWPIGSIRPAAANVARPQRTLCHDIIIRIYFINVQLLLNAACGQF